jgi:HEAT repeat protein
MTLVTGFVAGLLVSSNAGNLFAQRVITPRAEDLADMFNMVIPPIPPVPPLPPIPPLEGFRFEFGQDFKTADPEVRLQQEVFRTLVRNNPDRALEIAAERLKTNPKDPVVLANLSAIANSGSSQAMPLLVSIAKTSTDSNARREAVSAIARTRSDKSGLAVLEEIYASNSANVEVRRTIVSSIGRSTDSRAITVLAGIVKNDPDSSVRQTAVQQLGTRKEPEALKALEDFLKEAPKTRG